MVKVAVPLFFMITGALLLPKVETLSVLFRKRIFRFVFVILAFQIIQHAYGHFSSREAFSYSDFLYDVLIGKSAALATWFLYAYLAVLLLLPLLRILAQNMSTQHFVYLFALHLFLTSFIPLNNTLQNWLVLSNYINGQNVFVYLFAGYFIENRLPHIRVNKSHFGVLIVGSFFSVLLGAALCEFARRFSHLDSYNQWIPCFQGCVFIPCLTIFLIAQRLNPTFSRHQFFCRIVSTLAGAVFSLMLVENILRRFASGVCKQLVDSEAIAGVLALATVYLIGFSLGILLKKLPIIGKYV